MASFSSSSSSVVTSYVLLLLLLPLVAASLRYPAAATSPRKNSNGNVGGGGQAARLIRSLNLFPKHGSNVIVLNDDESDQRLSSIDDLPAAGITEKKLSFNVTGGAGGESVEELGHYAGYYSLPRTIGARMFYFFFESRSSVNKSKAPVVIWLTGGPGCSSSLALFYENGPFHITDSLGLQWNDYGWDQASNILFVDQPIGTGFSYTTSESDIRRNETGVSNDLYDFLQGFAIGNGLTDPEIQYRAYPEFAAMIGDYMLDYELGIPELLENGIKVLIYAGEYDLICNWLGNWNWVHAMKWSGQEQFDGASTVAFMVGSAKAGELKGYGPLHFLKVYNAGHMVPMDQPKVALEMLQSWMQGRLGAV
ncbi:unnamed protein product [Linum tenue]|uniref:Uncharacterized protein n=1 Tax=Linum tenue TaxID=586396 RepID=A0AAV0N6V5_9ROSI|nr:unnamed protein product [Linum tenue]